MLSATASQQVPTTETGKVERNAKRDHGSHGGGCGGAGRRLRRFTTAHRRGRQPGARPQPDHVALTVAVTGSGGHQPVRLVAGQPVLRTHLVDPAEGERTRPDRSRRPEDRHDEDSSRGHRPGRHHRTVRPTTVTPPAHASRASERAEPTLVVYESQHPARGDTSGRFQGVGERGGRRPAPVLVGSDRPHHHHGRHRQPRSNRACCGVAFGSCRAIRTLRRPVANSTTAGSPPTWRSRRAP